MYVFWFRRGVANRTDREICFLATRRGSDEKTGHSSTISGQCVVVNSNRRTKIVNSSYSTFWMDGLRTFTLITVVCAQIWSVSGPIATTGKSTLYATKDGLQKRATKDPLRLSSAVLGGAITEPIAGQALTYTALSAYLGGRKHEKAARRTETETECSCHIPQNLAPNLSLP